MNFIHTVVRTWYGQTPLQHSICICSLNIPPQSPKETMCCIKARVLDLGSKDSIMPHVTMSSRDVQGLLFQNWKNPSVLLSLAAMTAEMKEWLELKNVYLVHSSFTRCKLLQLILQIKQDSESIFLHRSHWGRQCEKWNLPSVMARGQHSTNQTWEQSTGRWEPGTATTECYQTWTVWL